MHNNMTMKNKNILTIILMAAFVMAAISVSAKPKQKKVWMFAYAASFTDSTAYVSDLQEIETAYIETKTGFLYDRSLYSLQFKNYLEENLNIKNPTCAVFFHTNRAKVEKKFLRIRKEYKDFEGMSLKQLNAGTFSFEPIEWIDRE